MAIEFDKSKGFGWSPISWSEYVAWQKQDKRTVTKINKLVNDILRNGLIVGEGQPERLKYVEKQWSRRIDKYNRLVYTVKDKQLFIVSCKGHYDD